MTVAWFDGVTFTVEVAFTTAPLATTPTYTDVSAYVRNINMRRGRTDEFSKFGPGTCSVTFSNRDRRFDPEYSAGAYYGNLNPMKKIRVRATYNAVTYDMFVGFVQGWPQAYEWTFDSTVTVNAVDASRILESSTLDRSAYEAAVLRSAPLHYWQLDDYVDQIANRSFTQSVGNGSSVPGWAISADQSPVINAASAATTLDGPSSEDEVFLTSNESLASAPLTLEFWMKVADPTVAVIGVPAPSVTVASDTTNWMSVTVYRSGSTGEWNAAFSNSSLAKKSTGLPVSVAVATGWHHVVAVATTGTMKLYIDGVEVSSMATSAGTTVGASTGASVYATYSAAGADQIAHLAIYSTSLTAADVLNHYNAGLAFGQDRSGARIGRVLDEIDWPAADRTLSTGGTFHGVYIPDRQSAMGYAQDVETGEDGYLFVGQDGNIVLRDRQWQWTQSSQATFSDDGADVPYESITIDANSLEPLRTAVSVTYGPNDAYIKVEDATAKAAYGPALEALSIPTVDDSVTARALAAYRLRAWKDPATRITEIRVNPRAAAATSYPAILGLELGDRVTVERTPQGVGSQIVKSLTAQGIAVAIDRDGTWTSTLYLSPAPDLATAVPYLILGDATYGKIGAVAGNKIPF